MASGLDASSEDVGKVVYRVELDTSGLEEGVKKVKEEIADLSAEELVERVNSGLVPPPNTKAYERAMNELRSANEAGMRTLLDLAHAFGDLDASVEDAEDSINQFLNDFSAAGGNVESLIETFQRHATDTGVNFFDLSKLRADIELTQEKLEGLAEGTAEYRVESTHLAEASVNLQQKLHALDETYKPLYTTVQQYNKAMANNAKSAKEASSATEEYSDSTSGAQIKVVNLAAKIGSIIAAFATLKRSISAITESVEAYREVEESSISNGWVEENGTLTKSFDSMDQAIKSVKVTIGSLIAPFASVVENVAAWIAQNRELVASVTIGLAVAAGGIATIGLVTATIKALNVAIGTLGGGLVTAIALGTALLAVFAGMSASNVFADLELDDLMVGFSNTDNAAKKYADSMSNVDKKTKSASASTKDFAKQMERAKRNFLESLKQIVVTHENSIASIQEDLEDLRAKYEETVTERNAAFEVEAAKEARTHEELVDELTGQLNFLQRYNNAYNAEKLARVQFALEKEQNLYERESALRREELELQNKHDQEAYEKRREELTKELQKELDFMEKHRDDIASVRDVMLLDEIDSLKRSYAEQLESYQQQQLAAATNASALQKTWQDYYDEYVNMYGNALDAIDVEKAAAKGREIIERLFDGMLEEFGRYMAQGGPIGQIWKFIVGEENFEKYFMGAINYTRPDYSSTGGGDGWALGGYTGAGPKYEVAGIVHRGEYVLPQEQVDQETGQPKLGNTQNITINVSGTFATSAQERRRVAEQIADAFQQLNRAGRTITI